MPETPPMNTRQAIPVVTASGEAIEKYIRKFDALALAAEDNTYVTCIFHADREGAAIYALRLWASARNLSIEESHEASDVRHGGAVYKKRVETKMLSITVLS